MGPVLAAIRLLEEDPGGWVTLEGELFHAHTKTRIALDGSGPVSVNGFRLGWWRRWLLRRAVWRRMATLVDDYLARREAARLRAEEAEADRLLTEASRTP